MLVPVSYGELLDKITILQLKSERITDGKKIANILHELSLLEQVRDAHLEPSDELDALMAELREVNEALWDIEDDIRICEKEQCFDSRFIELARSVYITNDKRAELKYKLNALLGSDVVEEKSYESYTI